MNWIVTYLSQTVKLTGYTFRAHNSRRYYYLSIEYSAPAIIILFNEINTSGEVKIIERTSNEA